MAQFIDLQFLHQASLIQPQRNEIILLCTRAVNWKAQYFASVNTTLFDQDGLSL